MPIRLPAALSKKEELALFYRMRNPKQREDARAEIIARNIRLVVAIAGRMAHLPLSLDDRISAGNIGLLIAVDKFDLRKKVRFCTYATYWIRAMIQKEALDHGLLVHLPVLKKERQQHTLSLDAPISSLDDRTWHDVLAADSEHPDISLENGRSRDWLRVAMRGLRPRTRQILEMRYGLRDGKERTLEETGKAFGLVRERIRQIEAEALRVLRKCAK